MLVPSKIYVDEYGLLFVFNTMEWLFFDNYYEHAEDYMCICEKFCCEELKIEFNR